MNVKELIENRLKAFEAMKAIDKKASDENRALNDDERAQFDAYDAEIAVYDQQIKDAKRMEEINAQLNEPIDPATLPIPSDPARSNSPLATPEYKDAFWKAQRSGLANSQDVFAALQVGTDSEGGYVVPEEFESRLVVALTNMNIMRQLANVISTGSDRNIPTEATRGSATWLAEEAAYSESDPAFGQVVLGAHKLGRIIKVSEELMQDSIFDMESYIVNNFARTFADAEESAYVDGDGSGKPTGVVGGSVLGKSFAGAAAITADEMIDLHYSLKRIYRSNAVYLVNDTTMALLRKLKDSDNQYLWAPGLVSDEPDRFLGRPIYSTDGMPAATTGLKSVVFGDMSYYQIADRTGRVMQRLNELYAANGQVGFRMMERTEGKLLLGEAVKHGIQA